MVKLKQKYLRLLEKDKKNIFEEFFYCLLCFLSFIYGAGVFLRNFLYQKKVLPSFSSKAKVISVGNLSWSGSGKTSLSLWLYERFSSKYKVAILRRGYGEDEGKLLKEKVDNVFSAVKRSRLAKKLECSFDLFVLDDGFQHRSLRRDVDIVMMSSRDFQRKQRLIPAYFFREPLSSLKRADILLLNYKEEMEDAPGLKKSILRIVPRLKIYFSQYKSKGFQNLKGNEFEIGFLREKKLAAFTAIGYPQGFFNKLAELGLNVADKIVYPDHYELNVDEFHNLEDELIEKGIIDLVITHKDKYHFPSLKSKLNIFILKVELEIEGEEEFLKNIEDKLARA